jgi:hypothetical protein
MRKAIVIFPPSFRRCPERSITIQCHQPGALKMQDQAILRLRNVEAAKRAWREEIAAVRRRHAAREAAIWESIAMLNAAGIQPVTVRIKAMVNLGNRAARERYIAECVPGHQNSASRQQRSAAALHESARKTAAERRSLAARMASASGAELAKLLRADNPLSLIGAPVRDWYSFMRDRAKAGF